MGSHLCPYGKRPLGSSPLPLDLTSMSVEVALFLYVGDTSSEQGWVCVSSNHFTLYLSKLVLNL